MKLHRWWKKECRKGISPKLINLNVPFPNKIRLDWVLYGPHLSPLSFSYNSSCEKFLIPQCALRSQSNPSTSTLAWLLLTSWPTTSPHTSTENWLLSDTMKSRHCTWDPRSGKKMGTGKACLGERLPAQLPLQNLTFQWLFSQAPAILGLCYIKPLSSIPLLHPLGVVILLLPCLQSEFYVFLLSSLCWFPCYLLDQCSQCRPYSRITWTLKKKKKFIDLYPRSIKTESLGTGPGYLPKRSWGKDFKLLLNNLVYAKEKRVNSLGNGSLPLMCDLGDINERNDKLEKVT